MATVAYTIDHLGDKWMDDVHVATWAALTTTDDNGAALEMPGSADRTIQFVGTFGAGGTIILEGSNLPSPVAGTSADWFTLSDPSSTAISKTAAAGEAVLELTRWIRPKVTAGDGTTSLTAYLLVKRK